MKQGCYNAHEALTFSNAQQILALSCLSSPRVHLDSFLPAKQSVLSHYINEPMLQISWMKLLHLHDAYGEIDVSSWTPIFQSSEIIRPRGFVFGVVTT